MTAEPAPRAAAGSHILDVIDKMIAAPVVERPPVTDAPNRHSGAAAATSQAPSPVLGPKGITVERPGVAKDALDEAAELFKTVFKGDIVP